MLTTRTLISTHTLFSSSCMDCFMFISLSLSFHLVPRISVLFYPPSSLSLSIFDLFPSLSSISFSRYLRSLSLSSPDLFPHLSSVSIEIYPSLSSISFPLYFDIYLFISIKVSRSLSMTHQEMNKNSTWCNFYSKFIVTFSLVSNFLLLIWLCFLFAFISSQKKTYPFLLFMFYCMLCLILWVKIEATSINHFSIYPTPFFSSHSFHLCIYWIFSLFSNSYIFKIDC